MIKKGYFFLFMVLCLICSAQVSNNAVAAYGTRKLIPAYLGNALQVLRTCDNATANIGFTSCGNLDTTALKTFVLASNPLSAMSTTVDVVYSLRKMSCLYVGSAIRVRSSAAGTPTMDIGFTSAGDLDTATLKTFVGANSAYITTWYDQSLNAYHATQTITASQPRIINAGVIDRQNGRPAFSFDGVDDFLQNNTYSLLSNGPTPTWNSVVVPLSTNNAYMAIVCWRNAGGIENALELGPNSNWNTSWWSNTNYNLTNGLSIGYSSFQILTSLYNATSNQLYVNGALSYSNTGQSNSIAIVTNPSNSATTYLLIGNDNCCAGRFLKGYLFEIVLSSINLSTTNRQFLEWSQAQYYGVTGPVLATLPASPASASVTTWYDQSGGTKNATQTISINQPRIINAGVIDKNGLIPALNFAGFPQNLVAPLSTSAYPLSISILANTGGNSSNGAFIKLGTSTNGTQGGIGIGIGNSGGTFDASGTSVIGLKEWVAWCPSSPNVTYSSNPFTSTTIQQSAGGLTTYLNGTNIPLTGSSTAVGANLTGNLFIGGYTNTTNRFAVVKESEVVIFSSALNTTQRTLLETNQAAYNAVTISNNKYTPPGAGSYQLYVNGVGRESATDSVAGTKITTGMGFSIGQAATDFLKDNGDYVTIGMNCPVTPSLSLLNLPGTVVQRWNNDWYLNKTDVNTNNGTLKFFFDFSDYGFSGVPGAAANYVLLARNSVASTFSIVPSTTVSVVSDRILFAVDAANILNNAYYTVGTTNTLTSVLPIELVSFDALCENDKVSVQWVVATQINNRYFSIERTVNGSTYELLATVNGAGTTKQIRNYSFVDNAPLKGISYYRLKQTDGDGSEKTYKLVQVNCHDQAAQITIYPNPSGGAFTLEGVALNAFITVYNTLGLMVHSQKADSSLQQIDLSYLPVGVYVIRVVDAHNETVQKLVIQR